MDSSIILGIGGDNSNRNLGTWFEGAMVSGYPTDAANDTGGDGAAVQLWDCQSYAEDQHWTHNPDDSLSTIGRCLDINGNGTTNGTRLQIWDCNGSAAQKFALS